MSTGLPREFVPLSPEWLRENSKLGQPIELSAEFIAPDPKVERVKKARELLRIARGSELIVLSDEVKNKALVDALDLILDIVSD